MFNITWLMSTGNCGYSTAGPVLYCLSSVCDDAHRTR